MNRAKSYKLLLVVLFILFVSLISRSILYLAVSMTVAVIIIALLTKDIKQKPEKSNSNGQEQSIDQNANKNDESAFFPVLLTCFGAVALFYGFSGVFTSDSMFHAMDVMTDEAFIIYFFFLFGVTVFIYGVTLMLKHYLRR